MASGPVMGSADYNIQPALDTVWFDVRQISQAFAWGSPFRGMPACQMLRLRPD
jgi:hypothetical protein